MAIPLKLDNGVLTNFQASDTLSFSGTIQALSLAGTIAVLQGSPPWNVSGTVVVAQPVQVSLVGQSVAVSGTVPVTFAQPVNVNVLNASIPVSGTVAVTVAQPLAVNANITNASVAVTGTVAVTQPVQVSLVGQSVNANITNASVTVTGTVAITQAQPVNNLPTFNNGKTLKRFVLSQVASAGSNQINPAVSGQKHKLIGAVFTVSADATVKFSGASDLTGAMDVAKQGGFVLPVNPTFSYVETGVNESFSITSTGGGANGVIIFLTEA